MREFGDVDTVRLNLIRYGVDAENIPPRRSIKPILPADPWHATINFQFYELNEFVSNRLNEVQEMYREDVRARLEYDGRVFDPALPVQINRGVVELAKILEQTELELSRFRERLELGRRKASFGTNTSTERVARENLNVAEKLIERYELFLHSYLWLLWMRESLEQANRFGGLLQNHHYLQDHDEEAFNYIAHPPLVVATLACTALIEEVGAKYVNSCTDGYVDPDETNFHGVIDAMKEQSSILEQYRVSEVESHVKDVRDDFSHYIRKRGDTLSVEEFGEFFLAVLEGGAIVRELLNRLLYDLLEENQETREGPEVPSVIEIIERQEIDGERRRSRGSG